MTRSIRRSYAIPSSADANDVNWLMSVPATKASPAPRSTNTRMRSSASTWSQASASASYIGQVIAFRASGRLNVRNATLPSDVNCTSGIDTQDLTGREQ